MKCDLYEKSLKSIQGEASDTIGKIREEAAELDKAVKYRLEDFTN